MLMPPTARGLTLVELLITLVLLAVLLRLAAPSFVTWSRNAQVRTTADAMQNGLRAAQAEAVRRNRQVVFSLTNATPSLASAAVANGSNWAIHVVPVGDEVLSFVQGGSFGDVAGAVTITGPKSICFNSVGRRVANPAPGVTDAACTIASETALIAYDVAATGADRTLRVTVGLGGQVRMCDPNRSLADGQPEACS
jgi:type IV fimbrial biogenesis protein FimT